MKNLRSWLLIAISLVAVAAGANAGHLVLLTTNDTHSRIDPDFDGKGGILRRKVIFDSVRAVEKNVLAIDAGDAVQGSLYFTLYGGKVEYAMLDSLQYDISILGNHEFDNGLDSIVPYYKKLKTTKLSANYNFDNTALNGLFVPFVIKEYDGKKVAFMGINLNPKGMISDANYKGLVYSDAKKTANETAEYLKKEKGADFVVMVSHIGYTAEGENLPSDVDIARSSRYIDLVIGGHSHTTVDPAKKSPASIIKNLDGKDVVVTQTGNLGKKVGLIDVNLEDGTLSYRLLPVDKRYDSRADYPALEAFLKPYRAAVDELMDKEVAVSAQAMSSKGLGAMANWVTDVTFEIAEKNSGITPDLAIMNRGGFRQSMPQGSISEGLINSIFPFDNKITIIEMTGADLLESFQVMASRGGDAVSRGVKVAFGADKKIKSATVNGKKVARKRLYRVATLDYLANGGDYMDAMRSAKRLYQDGDKYAMRMLEYLKALTAKGEKIKSNNAPRMFEVGK